MRLWQQLLAEAAGTFGLVLIGTGAITIAEAAPGTISHLDIAVAFGAIVAAMILAFGATSGAHINPAVSIAFWWLGRLNGKLAIPYILAQLGGALLASWWLAETFPGSETLGASLPAGAWWISLLLEFGLTFILMLGILWIGVIRAAPITWVAVVAGIIVGLEAYFAGPYCGASMNPARSIGPALLSGHTEHLWVYIVAPIAGALLAIPAYRALWPNKTNSLDLA